MKKENYSAPDCIVVLVNAEQAFLAGSWDEDYGTERIFESEEIVL